VRSARRAQMDAAGLTEILGGSLAQVERCGRDRRRAPPRGDLRPGRRARADPCIERSPVGASKAIHVARMAMRGDGSHIVTLEKAIRTMRETGADMKTKYKETSCGGLAVNVIECGAGSTLTV
jgi:L-serine dehydratase